MTGVDDLLQQGLITPFDATSQETGNCIRLAERDLSVAKETSDADWAFNIAYNALLQAGRAWMLSKGYRPTGETGHVAVVRFVEATLGRERGNIALFDSMRRKRHRAVYDEPGTISQQDVRSAIIAAGEFLALVRKKTGF